MSIIVTDLDSLQELFSKYGKIKNCRIIKDIGKKVTQ